MSAPLLPTRVWDLPTRVFHWLLAACVIGSVITAKIGGDAMAWHFRFGYTIFTLLAFRLVWGVIGGHWSRFATFAYSPATVWRYLRRRSGGNEQHDIGHSPLGALSVFGLLAVLALQVGSGLFADDDISNTGPLIAFVSGRTSALLTGWHKNWGQWLIIGLTVLHVAAILFYAAARGRNLVRPMWIGDKLLPAGVPAAADGWAARGLALLVLSLCAAAVAWLIGLGG